MLFIFLIRIQIFDTDPHDDFGNNSNYLQRRSIFFSYITNIDNISIDIQLVYSS